MQERRSENEKIGMKGACKGRRGGKKAGGEETETELLLTLLSIEIEHTIFPRNQILVQIRSINNLLERTLQYAIDIQKPVPSAEEWKKTSFPNAISPSHHKIN